MTKVTRIRETAGRRREVVLYRSTGGTLYAQSESRPNVRYCLGDGGQCQCKGFQHRGRCKHVEAAAILARMTAPQPPSAPAPSATGRCTSCGKEQPATIMGADGTCFICQLWPGR